MIDFTEAFRLAFNLIIKIDNGLSEIVMLSLQISFAAVFIASCIGLPIGAILAIFRFPGRSIIVVILNSLMGFNFHKAIYN